MKSGLDLYDMSSRDIEEAIELPINGPNHQHESENSGTPPAPSLQPDQPTEPIIFTQNTNSTTHLEVEKVIVLSFRSLQLQRISQLQDNLLVLALQDAAAQKVGNAPPDHTRRIDEALEDYGTSFASFQRIISCHT